MNLISRRRSALALVALVGSASVALANGFYITPEATYLEFRETNLDFAIESDDSSDPRGDVQMLNPDHDFGWALALGYAWEGGWDFQARYWAQDGKVNANAEAGDGYLFSTAGNPDDNDETWDFAGAEIDQDMWTLDLVVGRTFGDSSGTRARVFAGIRFAGYDERTSIDYFDGSDKDSPDDGYSITNRNDWDGFGITLGAEGHLALGEDSGWSVFGGFAVSALQGDRTVNHYEVETYEGLPDPGDETDLKSDIDDTTIVIEAEVGVAWRHEFDSVVFGIDFGYTIANWSDLSSITQLVDDVLEGSISNKGSDVGLAGGFLRFGFWW